jgi:Uma2 family endonuclease
MGARSSIIEKGRMSTIATSPEVLSPLEGPSRKQWMRAECALLQESGLWDGKHFELIDGELYNKMGKNRPHAIALTFLRAWLTRLFGDHFVETETSVDVAPEDNPTNEPESDIIVLTKPTWEFASNPIPADIRLAIELSDTTLRFDLAKKARLYARAGIVEYWVVDINARKVIVHRNSVSGAYESILSYAGEEAVASGTVANPFLANDLFHQ